MKQLLITILLFAFVQVEAQLSFTNPTPIANGWRFKNVSIGIDAIVLQQAKSSPAVVINDIDVTSTGAQGGGQNGYQSAWQPSISPNASNKIGANATWWIEFKVLFVNSGTYIPAIVDSFDVTGLDIDGDGGSLHEFNTFYYAGLAAPTPNWNYQYVFNKINTLTVSPVTGTTTEPLLNGFEFDGSTQNLQGIDTLSVKDAVTNRYRGVDSFTVRIGAKTDASGGSTAFTRWSSLYFHYFHYQQPIGLPVTLSSFFVSKQNLGAKATWTTSQEINNSYFVLQGSVDGKNFSDIERVNSHWSTGNSTIPYTYTVSLDSLTVANTYYLTVILVLLGICSLIGKTKSGKIFVSVLVVFIIFFSISCKKSEQAPKSIQKYQYFRLRSVSIDNNITYSDVINIG